MTPKETVQALYAAYATGDPDRIAALLHRDVIWVAPAGNATQIALGLGSADDAGRRGASTTSTVMRSWHSWPMTTRGSSQTWQSSPGRWLARDEVVLAEHRMSATLPNGRPYVNDYCFAYEVADGRVTAIREYMDTRGGWLQVFGGDAPEVLLKGTSPEA